MSYKIFQAWIFCNLAYNNHWGRSYNGWLGFKSFSWLSSERPDYLPASGGEGLLGNAPQMKCEGGRVASVLVLTCSKWIANTTLFLHSFSVFTEAFACARVYAGSKHRYELDTDWLSGGFQSSMIDRYGNII